MLAVSDGSTPPSTAAGRWDRLRRALGERQSQRLFEEVTRDGGVVSGRRRARFSLSLLTACALALLVHGLALCAGVLGLMLLARPWSNLFVPLGGVVLLLLCVAARPRPSEEPERLLERERFPALHKLSDRVAAALGLAPLDGIGVSADFNANYRMSGWRRRRHMELGSPLMAVLSADELTAIIAHEISHGANGDPLRVQFLGQAIDTLAAWGQAARPLSIGNLGRGTAGGPLVSLLGLPFELAMLGLSELLFAWAGVMLWLVMRESQRSEYLADLLAATVVGSATLSSALEKLYLSDVVAAALRVHALVTPHDAVDDRIADAVRSVDATDLEARRAASRRESWQADASHPPTAMRVDHLARRGALTPMVTVSDAERAALAEETTRLLALTRNTLVARHLALIYG